MLNHSGPLGEQEFAFVPAVLDGLDELVPDLVIERYGTALRTVTLLTGWSG